MAFFVLEDVLGGNIYNCLFALKITLMGISVSLFCFKNNSVGVLYITLFCFKNIDEGN
jgi:hypothetical protein